MVVRVQTVRVWQKLEVKRSEAESLLSEDES